MYDNPVEDGLAFGRDRISGAQWDFKFATAEDDILGALDTIEDIAERWRTSAHTYSTRGRRLVALSARARGACAASAWP